MNFNEKTALITGASVGIGRAVAFGLAELGADLVLVDIDFEKLCSVKKELEIYQRNILIFECDVTDEAKVEQITAEAISHFQKIDILINNAALWRLSKPFLETTNEEWRRFWDVNVMGPVNFIRATLGGMLERGYGRIVNVASVAGVYGNAKMVNYSATKGALIAMTKALAKEVSNQGVIVNCVSPGTVSPSKNSDMDFYTTTELCVMGRTGTDRENANLILFLASDEAPYLAGQNILIDGCRKKI